MEQVVIFVALAFAGWWLFRTGKRLGSRKGYGVGRFQRKSGRRRNYLRN